MLVDAVKDRIGTSVSQLSGRVHDAADFTELMRRNQLPQHTPAAHVLPLGLQGGQVQAATGLFTQIVEEYVGVLLTFRNAGATGSGAMSDLATTISAVIDAVAGWGPDDAIGVFRLARGAVVNVSAGTVVYQLDFAITDQLRIAG